MLSLTHLPQSRFHPHPIHPCFPYDIFLNLSLFEMLHLRSESPLFIIMFSSHNQKSTLKTVSKTGLYPLTFLFSLGCDFFLKIKVDGKNLKSTDYVCTSLWCCSFLFHQCYSLCCVFDV